MLLSTLKVDYFDNLILKFWSESYKISNVSIASVLNYELKSETQNYENYIIKTKIAIFCCWHSKMIFSATIHSNPNLIVIKYQTTLCLSFDLCFEIWMSKLRAKFYDNQNYDILLLTLKFDFLENSSVEFRSDFITYPNYLSIYFWMMRWYLYIKNTSNILLET